MTQPGLFDDDDPVIAHARRTDPITSHEAAQSLPSEKIRRSQEAVLTFLRKRGAMTDTQLTEDYPVWCGHRYPKQSSSGLRTRRDELVKRGLVVDSGRMEILPTGRRAIVWAALDKAGDMVLERARLS